ncbi:hypothetical protein IEO_03089 [Bacillus wiedmannii]|uniref:hypothetical protein n=1 Tax=Bacillus wiedmannii TaxID=1890302 RepID=UPI00027C0179|nr:hypothetical protein [Bacillus wiedmannii]EJV61794.1 hypothetical protein IEO_03089 [Bacillus wiedmannii]
MAKLDGVKVVNENTVEYNGFVYDKVDDKKREGDVLQALEDCNSDGFCEGEFFVVTKEGGQLGFNDNEDDHRWSGIHKYEFDVFRKSLAITNDKLTDAEGVVKIELPDGTKLEGTPSDLEKITRSMQKMQNEQQGQAEQAATVGMPEEPVEVEEKDEVLPPQLKAGQYGKVVEKYEMFIPGDIVKVLENDGSRVPYFAKRLSGGEVKWLLEKQLVKATDEEVLEAKQALLKVNDYARVIGNTNAHKFEIGTIVKLGTERKTDSENYFRADYLNESESWLVRRHDLEPLTKEEAEHIAREAEEEKKAKAERAKWEAIGREVGEIKAGDIVKVIDNMNGSNLIVGEIGEVSDNDGETFRVNTPRCIDVNWFVSERVELIVPVEQRFDTVG